MKHIISKVIRLESQPLRRRLFRVALSFVALGELTLLRRIWHLRSRCALKGLPKLDA